MKAIILFLIICCLSVDQLPAQKKSEPGMQVRIMNSGAIPTSGYKIYEHSFRGLMPGETSEYQVFKKLDLEDAISVVLKDAPYKIEQVSKDCKDCTIVATKKVTLKISIVPNEQVKNSYSLKYEVAYK